MKKTSSRSRSKSINQERNRSREALVAAQRLSDDMLQKARGEADLLIREARTTAERLLEQSQDQLLRLEDEIGRSKLERDAFEQRLRSSIEQHLELLEIRKADRSHMENVRVLRSVPGSEVG